MKKAKIVLSSLAVLTLVGGAMAYKAKGVLPYFTCNGSVCLQAAILAQDIQTSSRPGYVQVTLATTDAQSQNHICNDLDHPCTATIWTLNE